MLPITLTVEAQNFRWPCHGNRAALALLPAISVGQKPEEPWALSLFLFLVLVPSLASPRRWATVFRSSQCAFESLSFAHEFALASLPFCGDRLENCEPTKRLVKLAIAKYCRAIVAPEEAMKE